VTTCPPIARLRAELEAALVEAGFALHGCASMSPIGGVCVTLSTVSPHEPDAALIVTWSVSERLSEGPRYDVYQSVLATMNAALADVVEALGFVSEPFGQAGATLVTGCRSGVERPDGLVLDSSVSSSSDEATGEGSAITPARRRGLCAGLRGPSPTGAQPRPDRAAMTSPTAPISAAPSTTLFWCFNGRSQLALDEVEIALTRVDDPGCEERCVLLQEQSLT